MCPEELATIVNTVTRRVRARRDRKCNVYRIVYLISQFGLGSSLNYTGLYNYKKYNYPLGASVARVAIAAWPAAVAANLERFLSASACHP